MSGLDMTQTPPSSPEILSSALLAAVSDGVLIIDRLGRIEVMNPSAERIFGRASADMLGKPIDDLLPERYQDICNKWVARDMEKLQTFVLGKRFEVPALRADGSEFPLEFNVSGLTQETSAGFIVTFRDITESKEIIKAKEDAEMHLQREALVHRLVEMINQSLETPEILETAAREVGHFLQADRALVSRYNYDAQAQRLEVLLTTQYCANDSILPLADEDVDYIYKALQHLSPQCMEDHSVTAMIKPDIEELMAIYEALFARLNITELSLDKLRDLELKYGTQSSIRAGIFYNGIPYGNIMLHDCGFPREWQQDEIDLLNFVSDQLGIALAQAEMYQSEQKARVEEAKARKEAEMRLQREGLVRRLVEMINQSLEMPEILETAAREVGQFLQVDRALVTRYNYDAEAKQLDLLLTSQYCANQSILPYSDQDVDYIYKAFQHLSPQLLEEHSVTTVIIRPWEEMEGFYREIFAKLNITELTLDTIKDLESKYATRSAIRAGIFYNGRPYGTINLNQCSYDREWTADDIDLLNFVSDQLGIALAQAEMYQAEQKARVEEAKARKEAEMRLQREGLVRRLVEMINQSLDMHVILETAAHEVGQFLQADRAIVTRYDYDESNQKLDILMTEQYCANETILPVPEEDTDRIYNAFQHLSPQTLNTHSVKTFVMPEEGKIQEVIDEWQPLWSQFNINLSLDELFGIYKKNGVLATLREGILYNGVPYGAIMLQQCGYRREWTQDEKDLLDFVSDQLGIALAQAESYQAEQKARLEEAKARQEAETANRKKSEFLAMMSHELRTPLNAIIGYSRMIEKRMAGPINEMQTKYIQNVGASGKHLLDIVNDLLDVSQMETGKMAIFPCRIEVRPMLDDVQSIMQELADKKHISLLFTIQPDIVSLEVDPARFKQILINLLTNAIKFNHAEGYVRLRLSRSDDEEWIIGEVEDNGIGIPSDKQADLFKKFYQVDAAIARTHEGTGLGLALTKELVELHGGEIHMISEEGRGSTFTFCLPVHASKLTKNVKLETMPA